MLRPRRLPLVGVGFSTTPLFRALNHYAIDSAFELGSTKTAASNWGGTLSAQKQPDDVQPGAETQPWGGKLGAQKQPDDVQHGAEVQPWGGNLGAQKQPDNVQHGAEVQPWGAANVSEPLCLTRADNRITLLGAITDVLIGGPSALTESTSSRVASPGLQSD